LEGQQAEDVRLSLMKKKEVYLKIFQWGIVVAIFIFLGKMVWQNWIQVKEAPFTFRPFPLLLSTLIFVFSYFIQIWAWYLITLKLGIAISFLGTLESWFYSQLGKYLPGKVWLLLGRFYFYESQEKSRKEISVALYLETVTILIAAGLLSLIALLFFKETNPYDAEMQLWWLFPLLIVALFSLHPWILQKILNRILIQFKREPISLSISYFDILWILFVCVLAWVVGGIGFYLFVDSVFPTSLREILFLTGALAFSSTLGLIALFAPSGLGVREGALVYLLSFIMPGPVAVILSILTRIWVTLIEIVLIGVIYLISKFRKGIGKRNQDVQT
jgi:uncharacterized membrane protein YbhN (UPF0104 family)